MYNASYKNLHGNTIPVFDTEANTTFHLIGEVCEMFDETYKFQMNLGLPGSKNHLPTMSIPE